MGKEASGQQVDNLCLNNEEFHGRERKEEKEIGGKKTEEKMEKENLGFPGGSVSK